MRVVGFAERRGRSVRPLPPSATMSGPVGIVVRSLAVAPSPSSTVSGSAGIVVRSLAVAPSRDPSGGVLGLKAKDGLITLFLYPPLLCKSNSYSLSSKSCFHLSSIALGCNLDK